MKILLLSFIEVVSSITLEFLDLLDDRETFKWATMMNLQINIKSMLKLFASVSISFMQVVNGLLKQLMSYSGI